MPKTVDDAFAKLLSGLVPSETETAAAASHRISIKSCLENSFGMTNFFRAGSFGHGTSIKGISDVDYFAVIPVAKLKDNSTNTLRELKEALQARFPNTPVYVDSPAVAVQFGKGTWERHEITPAEFVSKTGGYGVYDMPNRYGGWMKSSPTGLNAYVDEQNNRLSKNAKPLIRLLKAWNYYNNAQIRSIYIELRVAEYLKGETTVIYPHDVFAALKYMKDKNLATMWDPLGLGAGINPCSDATKITALSKLSTAVSRAGKAVEANAAGKVSEAFDWWDKLYNGNFPGYY